MKIEPVVESYDKVVRDIQSNLVVVGSGERISGNRTPIVVKAIWDTGAHGSVISCHSRGGGVGVGLEGVRCPDRHGHNFNGRHEDHKQAYH